MNRYQQQVADMDRRHAVMVRVLSFVGAAVLIVAALWGAGFPPNEWWAAIQRRLPAHQPEAELPTSSPEQPVLVAPTPATPSAIGTLVGTDSSLSPTPQPLYLVATMPGRNKHEGTARIGISLENPQTYAAGALLANGARLVEIHSDKVVLARGGISATLRLYQRDPRKQVEPSRDPLLSVGEVAPVAPRPVPVSDGLNDYLRPSPVYDGDVLRGYQVYPGVRSAVFASLGLEPADVVTSINDAPLNDPGQAMELFAQLMSGTAVVATVERKGTTSRITLDGALIAADKERAAVSSQSRPQPSMPTI